MIFSSASNTHAGLDISTDPVLCTHAGQDISTDPVLCTHAGLDISTDPVLCTRTKGSANSSTSQLTYNVILLLSTRMYLWDIADSECVWIQKFCISAQKLCI